MNNDIHYPIKYAIMEVKTKGGIKGNYNDVIHGYILSKVYVVETNIKYLSDGTHKVNHKVVFPYEDFKCITSAYDNKDVDLGKRQTPRFDAVGIPYPVRSVDALYDTYEEAEKIVNEKNLELKRIISLNTLINGESNWSEQFDKAMKDIEEERKKCLRFEREIQDNTQDMEITDELEISDSHKQTSECGVTLKRRIS